MSFETCTHAVPCCEEHFEEYFLGVGWERYYEVPEDFEVSCPDCCG